MKKLFALLVCVLLVFALVSCGDDPCSHRDADDNSLCDNCGESYTDEKDLPDEHTHNYTVKNTDNKYLDKAADCENAATYFYSCSCGAKGTTTFTNGSANGHSYTVKSTDSKYLDKAADCENAATYFYSCSCGAKGTTTFTHGSANGHSYTVKNTDSKYLDKIADCENAATYFYSCSCGAKGTTTFTNGSANGHSYVIQNVDPKYEKTPASEYTPAVYWKSCACGKASTTETFTHGDMFLGYLTYQLSNDSSFYIVTGFVGSEENITIPHIYDALPVFGIMENAFKNNTTLKSISIPNSIQEIGSYAFAGCTALESISIPTSVKSIFSYTFSGCTSLKTVTLHSGIEELGAFAFENCTALKSITLNEGLKTISNNAFDNCSSLEGITIPDTVTALGNMAFRDAISLKYVVFSKALATTGNATFENCVNLEAVELYENITTLGNSTFSNCRGLKTLRILGDLKSIGIATFYDCVNLESIYFASKAKGNIGNTNYIFYNAGINGDGITLTVAKDAIIPEGIFEPFKEDNAPKITQITIEEDSTSFTSFRVYNYLPYLIEIDIPETVLEFDYGIFNNSLWWNKLTDGAVYIDHIFYGIKGETPKVLEIASDTLCIARGALKGHTNITELNIPDSVTYIGSEAFSGCSSLTSVTIPDSVTSIGSSAFSGCSSLESITLPFVGGSKSATSASSSTLFGYIFGTSSYTGGVATEQYYNSSYYTTYYIPSSLKSVTVTGGNILFGAFYNCTGLTSVTIPDSVTSIGYEAFYNCDSLRSVVIPDSVETLGEYAFAYCSELSELTLGNSIKLIGNSAFYYCDSLTSVVIPDSVTSIGNSAFYYCDSLTSVIIPDSVTSIGSYAFEYCRSLTSVTIGDSVTSIGSSAFEYCYKLVEVINKSEFSLTKGSSSNGYVAYYALEIHAGESKIVNVDDYLFYTYNGVNYLLGYVGTSTNLILPENYNGENYEIYEYAFRSCDSLTSVVIPDSVTLIGSYAFEYCYKLVEVINHSSLNITIGSSSHGCVGYYAKEVHKGESKIETLNDYLFYTFEGVNYLLGYIGTDTELILPESYNGENYEIYKYAFYDCDSLTSVTIPDSVTSIGSSAFAGCSNLTSVVIPDSVTSIGDSAFYGCTRLTSIKYRGTSSQWNSISKGDYWNIYYNNNYGGYSTIRYTMTYNYTGE